jgi:hypothetical protein
MATSPVTKPPSRRALQSSRASKISWQCSMPSL